MDVEGNSNVVTYNNNLEKPLLIGGCPDLRDLYELQDDHNIYLNMSVILASRSLFFPVNANLCLLNAF